MRAVETRISRHPIHGILGSDHRGGRKPDFVRWMVSEGRAPVTVLPDLDPPVEGQPVRWRYLRTEFVTIDTQVEFSSQPSYKEQYALMRYARLGDIGEPRMLTVAFVIDEPDASERFQLGVHRLEVDGRDCCCARVRPRRLRGCDRVDGIGAVRARTIPTGVRSASVLR